MVHAVSLTNVSWFYIFLFFPLYVLTDSLKFEIHTQGVADFKISQ